jgi:hypothetical protein
MRPGLRISIQVARLTLLYLAALAPLVVMFDALDEGVALAGRVGTVATLLVPLCLAGATAKVLAASRIDGEWDLDALLGYSPLARLTPLLVGSILLAVAALCLGGRAPVSAVDQGDVGLWSLPAPVDPQASLWFEEGRWGQPDLSYWTTSPGSLSTTALWARLQAKAPKGARRGVDRAELLRRIGWSLALPLAVLIGFKVGKHQGASARRSPGTPILRAVLISSGGQLLWLLFVLWLAAYLSSTM